MRWNAPSGPSRQRRQTRNGADISYEKSGPPRGRKNHLFAGSDGGADRWAIVASLLATAKLNGIEPYAYLKDVIERMTHGQPANRIDDLLPWNWITSNVET